MNWLIAINGIVTATGSSATLPEGAIENVWGALSGWVQNGDGSFSAPAVPVSPPPTPAETAAAVAAAKSARIALATTEAGSRIVAAAVIGATPLSSDDLTTAINSIRTAYTAAVAAINALTDADSIASFTW